MGHTNICSFDIANTELLILNHIPPFHFRTFTMNSNYLFRLKSFSRNWIVLTTLLLLALMFLRGTPAWASSGRELNATVPKPTATPLPTPVPPATATPHVSPPENDDRGSGGGQSSAAQPTNTPTEKAAAQKLTATVKAQRLNVRSGPGTGYLVIGVLQQGNQIEVLEQNPKGTWWRICCVPGSDIRGWVSMSLVEPDFDITQAQKLIPQAVDIPPTPTSVPTQPVSSEVTSNTVAAAISGSAIEIHIVQSPTFPIQGEIVTLVISVTNPTTIDAIDVELRDELPEGLSLVDISTAENSIVQQDVTENVRQVYSILWPLITAQGEMSATVRLQIDPSLPDGVVLDNLAFAGATNLPGNTAGISIGMPPVDLPSFQ